MVDPNTIGLNSQPRRFLSALGLTSLKTGLFKIKEDVGTRALKPKSARTPVEIQTHNVVRAHGRTLLNISDAQSMLTTVEDSFETILDVLAEMKSLATEAGAVQDGTIFKKANGEGENGRITGNRGSSEGMPALRGAYKNRLNGLSREIDAIVEDTHYNGRPLLGEKATSYSFFVNVSTGAILNVSFEPLSAAELSVSAGDIHVSDNDEAATTLGNISDAMTHVQQHLNQVVSVQDRLTVEYEHLKTFRSVQNAHIAEVADVDSAREQLELTKLQIIEDSSMALLAQANTSTSSAMHLTAAVRRDNDGEPFARIYSIDHDRDTAPVTHLRRIMLGQPSESS